MVQWQSNILCRQLGPIIEFLDDSSGWVSDVCPSTQSVFDFNEIWYVGRGLQV